MYTMWKKVYNIIDTPRLTFCSGLSLFLAFCSRQWENPDYRVKNVHSKYQWLNTKIADFFNDNFIFIQKSKKFREKKDLMFSI